MGKPKVKQSSTLTVDKQFSGEVVHESAANAARRDKASLQSSKELSHMQTDVPPSRRRSVAKSQLDREKEQLELMLYGAYQWQKAPHRHQFRERCRTKELTKKAFNAVPTNA